MKFQYFLKYFLIKIFCTSYFVLNYVHSISIILHVNVCTVKACTNEQNIRHQHQNVQQSAIKSSILVYNCFENITGPISQPPVT